MNTETLIQETGRIEPPLGEIPYLFLPAVELFARRAERLRQLARGHALGDYLAFAARLAAAQHEALRRFPLLPLPDPAQQELCRTHGMPLLGTRTWPRDHAWRSGLRQILEELAQTALPAAAREAVAALSQAEDAQLEQRADRILAGDLDRVDPAEFPLVAAALQAYWVSLAQSLGAEAFGRAQEAGICPVCGSFPVAGVVRSGGAENGLRYLSCSLCATQWHLVRVTCSSCAGNGAISYLIQEGSDGAVKVESCADCGSYLKLFYLEKDGRMEAAADDLATLTFDLTMGAEGKVRGGTNLLFHPGNAD